MENYKINDYLKRVDPSIVRTKKKVEDILRLIMNDEFISKTLSPEDQMLVYRARADKKDNRK
jgi:hypothetical protein